ncbi:MAG: hypothetical protein R3E01_25810 [Pirellulaceae bacterium]|nr:hypothetical protein [Planctomycetales bacterium]
MIRTVQVALIITCGCLGSGCRLFDAAWRTTVVEPIQYSRNAYEKFSRRHFTELAEFALAQAKSEARAELDRYDCEPYSADYEAGFVDGYVDYLEAGGSGIPSPMPPRRYWRAKYQNPEGFQRVEEWVQGFQHGAAAAKTSHYRSYVVIPVKDAVATNTIPYGYGRVTPPRETEGPGGMDATNPPTAKEDTYARHDLNDDGVVGETRLSRLPPIQQAEGFKAPFVNLLPPAFSNRHVDDIEDRQASLDHSRMNQDAKLE